MRNSLRPDHGPRDTPLSNETERPHDGFGKDAEAISPSLSGSDTTSEYSAQAGVKRIEAVSKAWSKKSLIIAYVA